MLVQPGAKSSPCFTDVAQLAIFTRNVVDRVRRIVGFAFVLGVDQLASDYTVRLHGGRYLVGIHGSGDALTDTLYIRQSHKTTALGVISFLVVFLFLLLGGWRPSAPSLHDLLSPRETPRQRKLILDQYNEPSTSDSI